MVKFSIGTAGWDYKGWSGTFYPKNLEKINYLEFYAKYFNIIEINSSFYNLPSPKMVSNWVIRVPQNFRFIIKVWQEITHKLGIYEIKSSIKEFFQRFKPLEDKIVGFLFQFPPRFNFSENHRMELINLINELPQNKEIFYIIELRNNSWFYPEKLTEIIDGNRIILATTYKPRILPYYLPNQQCYYIRLIGDRKLTYFGRIQREQQETLQDLFGNIPILEKNPNIFEIFIIVNNHFQGFAPESANNIKKRLGIPFKSFNHQKSLTDYF